MSSGTILHIISGDLWGGKEAQMLFQLTALKNLGWDVRVLVFNSSDTLNNYKKAGIACIVVEESKGLLSLLKGAYDAARKSSTILVISHGYKEALIACVLSVVLRCPFVSTFHGSLERFKGWAFLKAYFNHHLCRFLSLCCAKKIVCVSNSLVRELGFSKIKKVHIVYNVVGNLEVPCVESIDCGALISKRPALIIVGRLVPVKRVELAVTALAVILQDELLGSKEFPHLYVVGDGPERSNLEVLVSTLDVGKHVHFLGFRDNASELIAAADVFLITSDMEGIPTVVLEAVCAGVPIVSSELEGVREIFDRLGDYPITFVPRGDAKSISEGVLGMLRSSTDKMQVSRVRENLQKHFAPEVAAKRLDELYRELLSVGRCNQV